MPALALRRGAHRKEEAVRGRGSAARETAERGGEGREREGEWLEVGPVIVSALILDQFTGYTRVCAWTLRHDAPSRTQPTLWTCTQRRAEGRRITYSSCSRMYIGHVRTYMPTDWCSRELSWKPYLLPQHQPIPKAPHGPTDRPTDVNQRQRLTPPCKTIRLRSHSWGSHYLTLSIGGKRSSARGQTHILFPSGSAAVDFRARGSSAAKWRNSLTTRHFPHGLGLRTSILGGFFPLVKIASTSVAMIAR